MHETPPARTVTQVIWAHPRTDSLTAAVVQDVIAELEGHPVEEIDLYRTGFDPVIHERDEPDWDDVDHRYSDEVMEAARRTGGAAAVVFVFPVMWFSLPAIMKGYIDRVWNFGIFYGAGRRTGLPTVRWVALAGDPESKYRKRRYDEMMAHHLNVGIAGYCGVSDSRVEMLYNTFANNVENREAHFAALRAQARAMARQLANDLTARRRLHDPIGSDA